MVTESFRSWLRSSSGGIFGMYKETVENEKRRKSLEVAHSATAARRLHSHLLENLIVEDFSHSIAEFYDFDLAPILGIGMSGVVRLCEHKETRMKYAIKTLCKRHVKPEKIEDLRQEIRFLAEIDHPNIVTLHEVFENRDYIYLVMELCDGGELLLRLEELHQNRYPESVAREYVETMFACVAYLHDKGIVHRDIKLENFVFEDDDEKAVVKLIDFGLSKHFKEDEVLQGAVGTPFYVAPEVLNQGAGYSEKCDVWSMGVIAYMLIAGFPPFKGTDDRHTLELVMTQPLNLEHEAFSNVSPNALSMLAAALERNPDLRPSAKELLRHPWFQEEKKPKLSSLTAEVISRLKAFGRQKTFVKIALEVLAHTLTPDQTVELRKQFSEFDIRHAGVLRKVDVEQTLKQYGTFVPSEIDKIFDGIDMIHEQSIRFHEFIAAAMSIDLLTEANFRAGFLILSKHNHEFIRQETVRELLGADLDDKALSVALEEVGVDHSENISYERFKEIVLASSKGEQEGSFADETNV